MGVSRHEYEEGRNQLEERIEPFIEDVFNFAGFITMLGEDVDEDGENYQDEFVTLIVNKLEKLKDTEMFEMSNFFNLLNLRMEEIQAKRAEEREVGYEERRITEQDKWVTDKARLEALRAEEGLPSEDEDVTVN